MTVVGLNGNNAPPRIEGIDARLYMGLQARAFTYEDRELDNPDLGLGLADGLSSRSVPEAEWRRRVERSFRNWMVRPRDVDIVYSGNSVELQVEIEEP